MKRSIIGGIMIIAVISLLLSYKLPDGWFKAGSQPAKYDMGTDIGASRNGKNAATIKSISPEINGFGTLMQESLPGAYLGKRVRMSGYMKSVGLDDWAGFWFRVDQANSKESLSFDNMQNRAIKGTTAWKKYEIVLDVPKNASRLAYGALLSGTGQIWFDDIKFEIVSKKVPATGNWDNFKAPKNLNFEK